MNVDFFIFNWQNQLRSWGFFIQTFHLALSYWSFGFKGFIKLYAFLSQLNVFVLSDIAGLFERCYSMPQ